VNVADKLNVANRLGLHSVYRNRVRCFRRSHYAPQITSDHWHNVTLILTKNVYRKSSKFVTKHLQTAA